MNLSFSAALRDEKELSVLLCNSIGELPVTLENIKKLQRKTNSFFKNEETGMSDWKPVKKIDQGNHLIQSASKYNYMQIVVIKENPEKISYRSSKHDKNEVINA